VAWGTRLTTAALAGCALVVASAMAASASSSVDAPALYRQALAATRAWSVHYTSSSAVPGSTASLVLTGDAGPASGTQTVTMGTGSVSIRVIGGITYLSGNAGGLQNLAGFTTSEAALAAGQWIRFATTDSTFASVVVGVRSADLVKELELSGRITAGRPTTLDGLAVDAVRGHQTVNKRSVPVVLYVRAAGTHVPVEEDSENAAGHHTAAVHIVFSDWGEAIRPFAPQATITVGPVTTT
jgi:hypothetical protein